jgi:transcription elongation factor Elf1
MEVTACPVCGSKNIGIGTLGDGIISGLSSWKEVCRNCGYQGPSVVFESEAAYNKFLEALARQKTKTGADIEKYDKENQGDTFNDEHHEEDKNFDYLEDVHSPVVVSEKKTYRFEFVLAVALSIVFFVILFGSNYLQVYSGLITQNDLGVLLLFMIGSFLAVVMFFFFFIVIIEMIYRGIHKKKT